MDPIRLAYESWKARPSRASMIRLLESSQFAVYGTCHEVLRHRQDAEDAAQAVLIEIQHGLDQVSDADHFIRRLRLVAFRTAINALRDRRRRIDRERKASEMNRTSPVSDEVREAVHEALAGLDEDSRDLVIEHYFEKTTLEEMGVRRGVTGAAIWKRIEGVKVRLREALTVAGLGAAANQAEACLESAQVVSPPINLVTGSVLAKSTTLAGGLMAAKASIATVGTLVATGSLIGIFLLRTCSEDSTLAGKSQKSSSKGREGQGATTVPETPQAPTRKPEVSSEPKPIITWKQVPDAWAAWPAAGLGPGRSRGFISTPSLLALQEMEWLDPSISFPGREDEFYRAWGLMNSLDYLLASACMLNPSDDSISEDRKRLPLLLLNGVQLPEDTTPAREQLLALLSGGFDALISKMPAQHRGDGLQEAFRTRALSLLASLGNDPLAVQVFQENLTHSDARVRASAAYGLLLQGDRSAVVSILSEGEANPSLTALLGSLAGFHRKQVTRTDGSKDVVPDVQLDRSLDVYLLEAARRMPARRDLTSALAVRTDNPEIRSQVAAWLINSNDPAVAGGIVRVHPDLTEDPNYLAAAIRWFSSDQSDLRHWGLKALADIRSSGIPKLVSGMLSSDDPRQIYAGLVAQKSSVLLDPKTVLSGIKDLTFRNRLDAGTGIYAKQALRDIRDSDAMDPELRDEAGELLFKLGGGRKGIKKN